MDGWMGGCPQSETSPLEASKSSTGLGPLLHEKAAASGKRAKLLDRRPLLKAGNPVESTSITDSHV